MSDADPPCERLEWDSSFFGRAIARAQRSHADGAFVEAMLTWCEAQRIDCLYFLAPARDVTTCRLLDDAGFQLVDERVTLERDVRPQDAALSSDARPARLADLPALRAIAGVCHRESRFYADTHFDPHRVGEFYRVWIENSYAGRAEQVIVAEVDGHAAGYLTLHLSTPDLAAIGLLGVDQAHHRRGVGRRLMRGALRWLAARAVTRVSVVTQGRNTSSQAFYRSAGFRPAKVQLWYHQWFDDPAQAG